MRLAITGLMSMITQVCPVGSGRVRGIIPQSLKSMLGEKVKGMAVSTRQWTKWWFARKGIKGWVSIGVLASVNVIAVVFSGRWMLVQAIRVCSPVGMRILPP